MKISVIGGRQRAAKESVSLLVVSQKLPVTALVLNSIAGKLPSHFITLKQLKSIKSVALANENLHQPGLVQLLSGADVSSHGGYSMPDDQRFLCHYWCHTEANGLHLQSTMPTCEPFMVVPQQQWQK